MLNFNFTLTNKCNFNCDFCYNKFDPIYSEFPLNKIIEFYLKIKDLTCTISFIGGEPLLYKNFKRILNIINKNIYVYTNGSILTNEYNYKNVIYLVSPQSQCIKNLDLYFGNLLNSRCRIALIVLLNDDKIIDYLANNNLNFKVYYAHLFDKNYKFLRSNEHLFKNKYYLNNKLIDFHDIHSFKGWKCYIDDYEVNRDLTISPACNTEKIMHLKDIKEYIVCENNYCDLECFLNYPKILNGNKWTTEYDKYTKINS